MPTPVEGPVSDRPLPLAAPTQSWSTGPPLVTLSWGRGRACPCLPRTRSGGLDPGFGVPAETADGRPRTHPAYHAARAGVELLLRDAALSPSPLRERAGVRLAASVKQPTRSHAPSAGAAARHPLQWDRQNLPRTRSGARPSSAEFGEGSSGHPPSGYATVSPSRGSTCPELAEGSRPPHSVSGPRLVRPPFVVSRTAALWPGKPCVGQIARQCVAARRAEPSIA